MSSYAFAKLYSKSCCTIDFISFFFFFFKTYKFYNATLIVNIFQFIVASILHYCSLHRNAQYGLVPFRVLKLKIEELKVAPQRTINGVLLKYKKYMYACDLSLAKVYKTRSQDSERQQLVSYKCDIGIL